MKEQDEAASNLVGSSWIDVTVPIREGMVQWPGDPPVRIRRTLDLERGDACSASEVSIGSHTGTHIDAPLHFIREGEGIERMPLDAMVGRARVIQIHDTGSVKAEELARHRIRRGERILLRTANSPRCWQSGGFVKDFIFVSSAAARFLAERGVRVLGVDYFSVGGYKDRESIETHRTLLEAGVWVIEGLDLSHVTPGTYDFVCLPLKLTQCDGAPARVILRPVRGFRRGGKSTGK